jgi:3-isopropylmalate dehydrogenase
MSNFNIAVLPGDYVGPEVVAEARKVLDAVGERFGHTFTYTEALAGGAAYDAHGEHLPQSTLDTCAAADAILKGPFGGPTNEVNHPKWQGVEQNAILPLRKYFDLYLNIRPVSVPDSLLPLSPVKEEVVRGTDMLILRELISGIYFGPRGDREIEGKQEKPEREVWDTEIYRTSEIERMAHSAFKLAQERRKKVTLISKSNVLSTGVFWREVVQEVAKEYPDVALDYQHVDNASMQLITNPRQYDVMLTSNIIGDILSDEGSVLPGSIGLVPSASLNEEGFGLYEPIHGSAPDIAGQGKVNPISMILSAAMMLRLSFNLPEAALAVEDAVDVVLSEGARTGDIARAGEAIITTQEMGDRIAEAVRDPENVQISKGRYSGLEPTT